LFFVFGNERLPCFFVLAAFAAVEQDHREKEDAKEEQDDYDGNDEEEYLRFCVRHSRKA
jgi:hypothetical protein